MQLLVSVSNAAEARAAADGGADIIDAKDPSAGALGAVRPRVLSEIRDAVDPGSLVTAALGDAHDGIEEAARDFVGRGARLVKVGFEGKRDATHVEEILGRLVRACSSADAAAGVVAVAYADSAAVDAPDAMRLVSLAARSGARGVLVDTAQKDGPGLLDRWSVTALESWVAEVHAHDLMAAVAGKLRLEDLAAVVDSGADIAGVRGAACVGGRLGRVTAERVRAATAALRRSTTRGRV
jgi:uncharacterized protein (UPF0264 family)